MKIAVMIMLVTMLGYLLPAQAETALPVDPVSELQDAALNYEAAASAQLSVANSLLLSRQTESRDDEEAINRRRRNRNASLELQAAEQFMGGAGNFDHATRAWRAAAQATKEQAAREYFQRTANGTNGRATALIRRAAELAEQAALEYAALDDLRSQANASHRAGRIREQLAGRR